MRKSVLAMVISALAVIGTASPASAGSFDSHFSVNSKTTEVHRTAQGGFAFRDILRDPFDRTDRVGRDHGRCEPTNERGTNFECRIVVHLNGEVGGFGDLLVKGNASGNDNNLLVVNGTDDFNGVVGKMAIHNNSNLRFDLTR